MALQGTLKDFSITEILQLIGQQLKTGVLRIRRGKNTAEIYFVDGMIVHIFSNYRGKKDLIGEILVKAQLITEEELERVLRIQKETLKYVGEILVELKLLTKEDVLKVISTQVYETIYELFWWEDGTFNFDLKLVESYKKVPFALSTEQVLLNILRMVDEWSEIEKKINSPHLVFRKTKGPGEGSAVTLSPQHYLRERMTSEQEMTYNLVDGTRTVQEIVDRSLLGKFHASETLVNLMDLGLIEIAGLQSPTLLKRVQRVDFRKALIPICCGLFLALILAGALVLRPDLLHLVWESRLDRVDVGTPTSFIHRTQIQRIRNALEIYYLEKKKYPERLDELLSARLLQEADLFYQKGAPYQYELKNGKYFLKR
jgi:hypothetical protein